MQPNLSHGELVKLQDYAVLKGRFVCVCAEGLNVGDEMCWCTTYKLEAAADGGLDVGAAKGSHLAKLPGDLDGVVEEETQATLVTEARRAGNLSEQDWGRAGDADEDERFMPGQ